MNRLLWVLATAILFVQIGCSKSSSRNNTGNPNNSSNPNDTTSPPKQAPQITAIQPTQGPGGSADTILGSGFNANISVDSVYLNGVRAAVTASSDSQLIVTVPSLCGTGKVSLIENGGTVTGPVFTYDTVYGWTSIAQGFDNPRNLATDTAGNVYVTDIADGTISMVSPGGTVSTFLTGFQEPWGITIDQNDNIYIADIGTTSGTTIYKYNALGVGGQWATIDGSFTSLTCDNTGNVYAVYEGDFPTISVDKISASGTVSNLITDGGNAISFGICLNPAGGFYLSGGNNGLGSYINTLTSSGKLGAITLTGDFAGIQSADVLYCNGSLYVSSESNNSIYKISLAGDANQIITNIPLPWGLTVDKSGDILVAFSGTSPGQVAKITYK